MRAAASGRLLMLRALAALTGAHLVEAGGLDLVSADAFRSLVASQDVSELSHWLSRSVRGRHVMMLGDSTMYQPYISLVVLMGYDVPPLHGNDTSSETFFRSFVQPRLHQLKGKKQTPSPYFVHEFEKSSTVLSYTHAVNMRDNSKLMQRVRALETYAKRSASVVIVGQDLHLLQLWPAREFQTPEYAVTLGQYETRIAQTLRTIRQHVGPRGLVVWKHVNKICDSAYTGDYALIANSFCADKPVQIHNSVAVVTECDAYVRNATGNASLGCLDTQLASGGTTAILRRARDALSRSLPREDGIAQMRELDSFAITRDGCPLTATNDGRHYHGLDPLKLRVLAEGIVNALEDRNERRTEARRNKVRSERPKERTGAGAAAAFLKSFWPGARPGTGALRKLRPITSCRGSECAGRNRA